MGILDGIVDWLATQVMNLLDLISTSVLGALGCDMTTFKRYFPAAETMYEIFVWIGVGLLLLNLVWCLFKNFAAGLDVETEDPVKLLLRSGVFLLCIWYADDIVNLALSIGGTPYSWIVDSTLPAVQFGNFNSTLLSSSASLPTGRCAHCPDPAHHPGVELFETSVRSRRAVHHAGHPRFYCAGGVCAGGFAQHLEHLQELVPGVCQPAVPARYERLVPQAVYEHGGGVSG